MNGYQKVKTNLWGNALHICVETVPGASNGLRSVKTPTHVSVRTTTLGSREVLSVSIDKNGKPDLMKGYHYEPPNSSTNWRAHLNDSYMITIGDYGISEADRQTNLLRYEQQVSNALYCEAARMNTAVLQTTSVHKRAIIKRPRSGWKIEN